MDVAQLDAFRKALVSADEPLSGDPDEALQLIRALEECKNAATAAQARLAVIVHDAQRAADVDRGITANETARAVGWQLGMARRQGPRKGRTFLGFARAVVTEMPHTHTALREGRIGEWQATQIVSATSFLSLEDRKRVDDEVKEILGKVADRRLLAVARASAYRQDPEAFVARRAKAESERRVSLRPTEDCMTLLTALLPVKDGVACLAALQGAVRDRWPDDQRGSGQLMADALVARITGRPASSAPKQGATETEKATAPATATTTATARGRGAGTVAMPPPVAINLLVPLESLTGDAEAQLAGFGPIPAELARELVAENEAAGGSLRRVFTAPETGALVAMDSRSRTFRGLLATFIRLRDQLCRTPFCGAEIRQIDHIRAHATGGRTCEHNGGGDCRTCNYAKEHPDVSVTGDARSITVRAGGLEAISRPPTPPGRVARSCAGRVYSKRIELPMVDDQPPAVEVVGAKRQAGALAPAVQIIRRQ